MKFARAFVAPLLIVLALGGCARLDQLRSDIQKVEQVAGSIEVTAQQVVLATQTANTVIDFASDYLELPVCKARSPTICRDRRATKPIIKAVKSIRIARDQLQALYQVTAPTDAPRVKAYNALSAAIATARGIFDQYKVGDQP